MKMRNEDPHYTSDSLRYDQQGHTFICDHCGSEGKQWHPQHRFCEEPATCMEEYYKQPGRKNYRGPERPAMPS